MYREVLAERLAWAPAALDAEFRDLELAIRALEARRAANLAAAEALQVPAVDGHRSAAAYVRATIRQPAASALVRRARFCRDYPAAGEALSTGRVGVAQVDELVRVANHPRIGVLCSEPLIERWLEHAERVSFREYTSDLQQWVMLLDQDGAWREHLDDVTRRSASVRAVAGSLLVTGDGGDALTAERIERIFDRFVEAEFQIDAAGGDTSARSNGQRGFDALVKIFDTANAHGDAPGEPVDVCANVVIDHRTLHDAFVSEGIALPNGWVFDPSDATREQAQDLLVELLEHPDGLRHRRCHTTSGQPVHPRLVVQALLTGHIRRVAIDSKGVPISFGTKQRLFTGAAALAARVLTGTCEHPGCELPAHKCDIDHIVPASEGGPTDQANSAIECGPHNRAKHRQRWRTRRATDRRLYTYREDGTLMLAVGERPPDPTDAEQEAATRARLNALVARRLASELGDQEPLLTPPASASPARR